MGNRDALEMFPVRCLVAEWVQPWCRFRKSFALQLRSLRAGNRFPRVRPVRQRSGGVPGSWRQRPSLELAVDRRPRHPEQLRQFSLRVLAGIVQSQKMLPLGLG